ncbi:hypothetical protein [Rhodoferax sp. TH121]|uniref:hypothetical protein n=1 Tax=Rhodoferax sp. TH121 TaxID=2022803 RepID=UPI0011406198|nr:hypothetical protein [Rhodoferax sp. TH121]
MNAQLHPALAAAMLPFAPPQSVVHKIITTPYTPPAVDPKLQQSWDRAVRLELALPESLRGVM